MTRTRGLSGATGLRTERKPSDVVQAMEQAAASGSSVHVDDVAANPRNPQARAVKVEDLVPSVREVGVMVPILLTPVSEWIAVHPEDADAVAGKKWIAQDGHRRLAAAKLAGRPEVPFVVRGVDVDEAMIRLHTTKAMRLTPIEEATQYRHLVDRGMTQQEVASRTGVSQSHVAKRLKLLTLPEAIQTAIDFGQVEVGEALKLVSAAAKDPDLLERAGEQVAQELSPPQVDHTDRRGDNEDEADRPVSISLSTVVRRVSEERELEAGKHAAVARAEELNAEYCENIYSRLGETRWHNQIFTPAQIREAAAEKNLLVTPTHSEPNYYLIRRPRPVADDKQKIEARNRRAAIEARGRALRTAVTVKVSAVTLQDALVAMTLSGLALGSQTTTLAYDLARESDLAPSGLGDWTWRKTLAELPESQRAKTAWVIALAAFESYTRSEHLAWGAFHRWYFDLLRDVVDYVPTAWEQARIDALTAEDE